MLAMGKHSGDERFTWFGPPELNTLCQRENESCIVVCCSNVGLAFGCPMFSLPELGLRATSLVLVSCNTPGVTVPAIVYLQWPLQYLYSVYYSTNLIQ
jgi:hypothetical protein